MSGATARKRTWHVREGEHGVERLLEKARRGDPDAWAEIVGRFAGLAWSIARSEGCDVADAADACQTMWLRLVEHIDRIEEPERLGAWIATVTRRECRRLLERRRLLDLDSGASLDLVHETSVDEHVLGRERDEILWSAIEALPPSHRLLLRLMYLDPPLSYSEMAEVLGVPVGSIGPTRARAIESLRRNADIIALGSA